MELTLVAGVIVLFLIYLILTKYDYTDQYDVSNDTRPIVNEEPVAEVVEPKVEEDPAPVKKPRKPRTKKVEAAVVEKKSKATAKPKKKKSTRD